MRYIILWNHRPEAAKALKENAIEEIVERAVHMKTKPNLEEFRKRGLSEGIVKIIGEHLSYLQGLYDKGTLIGAGPFSGMEDAALIYEASSPEEARSFAENDPYYINGFIQDISVKKWLNVF